MGIKKIRVLQVEFENPIDPWEVPYFRGAVIATAGKENILFHNHLKDNYRYGYPLIQYKEFKHKPYLISLDEGVDEIHHFFENMQEGVLLGNRPYELKISNLHLTQHTLQVWNTNWKYRITNWLALNQENYQKFKAIESPEARIDFLQKTLTGNLISFAKGIDWTIERTIETRITHMWEPKLVTFKNQKIMAFNLEFWCNIYLPRLIGLGKGASMGFGIVELLKIKEKTE